MIDFTGGGLFGMRDIAVPEWKKKTVSSEELREAGMEQLVSECGRSLREKYAAEALRSMSKPQHLEEMLEKDYVFMKAMYALPASSNTFTYCL